MNVWRLFVLLVIVLCAIAVLAYALPSSNPNPWSWTPRPFIHLANQTVGVVDGPNNGPAAAGAFARVGIATEYDFAGTWNEVADGTAAITDVLSSGDTGTLQTGGPTGVWVGTAAGPFSALQNEDLTAAVWTSVGTPTRTANSVTDPEGLTAADRIEDEDAGVVEGITQQVATTLTGDWLFYVWARCTSAHTARLRITQVGGAAPSTTTSFTCSTTEWNRYVARVSAVASITALDIDLFPTDATAASTGTVDFWHPQLIKATAIATSATDTAAVSHLDPTVAGATVTINPDTLTYGSVSPTDLGTACYWYYMGTGTSCRDSFGWISGGVFLTVTHTTTCNDCVVFRTSGLADNASVPSTTTYAEDQWEHICATWDQVGADVNLYLNGTEVSYGTVDAVWTASGAYGSTLDFDTVNCGNGSHAIGHFMLWRRVLAAGEVAKVYRRFSGGFEAKAPVDDGSGGLLFTARLEPDLWLPFQPWSRLSAVDPGTGALLLTPVPVAVGPW